MRRCGLDHEARVKLGTDGTVMNGRTLLPSRFAIRSWKVAWPSELLEYVMLSPSGVMYGHWQNALVSRTIHSIG